MNKNISKKSSPVNVKKTKVKESKIAKIWKALRKDENNDEKLLQFYEIFLNTNFWLKLHESEEKNYDRFKKEGIRAGEKFSTSLGSDGAVLLFEDRKELVKMAEKSFKKRKKILFASVQQHGGEVIYSFSKNTEYSLKIKGVRDFVHVHPEGVAFMKKNFKQ